MSDPLKILLADDTRDVERAYNIAFDEEGFETKLVSDGEKVLEAYEEWKPDVILMDLQLPFLSGFEILKTIRKTQNDAKTTIIIVTAVRREEDIKVCMQLGIQGYVIKPFVAYDLADKVLDSHRKHQAKFA